MPRGAGEAGPPRGGLIGGPGRGPLGAMTDAPPRPVPTLLDLFLTYGKIGLIGFGGIKKARSFSLFAKPWKPCQ